MTPTEKAERSRILEALESARVEPKRGNARKKKDAALPGLSSTQRLVAFIIVRSGGYRSGGCWLGKMKIALRAGLTKRAVEQAINDLVAKGWIQLSRHIAQDGNDIRAYRVTPVEADIMSRDEINGIVAQDRKNAAERKAKHRMKHQRDVSAQGSRTDATRSPNGVRDVSEQGAGKSPNAARVVPEQRASNLLREPRHRKLGTEERESARMRVAVDVREAKASGALNGTEKRTEKKEPETGSAERDYDRFWANYVARVLLLKMFPKLVPDALAAAREAMALDWPTRVWDRAEALYEAIAALTRNVGSEATRRDLLSYVHHQRRIDDVDLTRAGMVEVGLAEKNGKEFTMRFTPTLAGWPASTSQPPKPATKARGGA